MEHALSDRSATAGITVTAADLMTATRTGGYVPSRWLALALPSVPGRAAAASGLRDRAAPVSPCSWMTRYLVPFYKIIELKHEFAAVSVRVGVPGGSLSTARQI